MDKSSEALEIQSIQTRKSSNLWCSIYQKSKVLQNESYGKKFVTGIKFQFYSNLEFEDFKYLSLKLGNLSNIN